MQIIFLLITQWNIKPIIKCLIYVNHLQNSLDMYHSEVNITTTDQVVLLIQTYFSEKKYHYLI